MCSWMRFQVQDLDKEDFRIALEYKSVLENSTSRLETVLFFGISLCDLLVIRGRFVINKTIYLNKSFY